ncbi:MAG: nucleotide sugar dehydrogenase [Acidimicrobiales bacterium]
MSKAVRSAGSSPDRSETLLVIGQGYVGLPLALAAVDAGFTVVGFDTDQARVKRLAAASSYVEHISDETLTAALATGRYRPTVEEADCAGFDVAVIDVPTPLKDGQPYLAYVEAASAMVARQLRPGATVILESTTYPGTTEELVRPILEEGSGLVAGDDFFLCYSPERIDPGNTTWDLITTPKVVSGVDAGSLAAVDAFYSRIVDTTVPVSGTREAELVKLLENTFRHVNVALVNELAMFAADLGIDVWEAIGAASTKPFGFLAFTPGPGVGGHCLPIDPSYLSWRVKRRLGHSFRFVELANDVNDHMPDYVVRRLVAALNRRRMAVSGARVLLVGLAYKANTGDARESPATVVAERLLAMGADLAAVDPHVMDSHVDPRVERVEATPDEAARSDAVVILVDHDVVDLAALAAAAPYVLDTRHKVPPAPHVEYL